MNFRIDFSKIVLLALMVYLGLSLSLQKHECGQCVWHEVDQIWKECDFDKNLLFDNNEERECANNFVYQVLGEKREPDSPKVFIGIEQFSHGYNQGDTFEVAQDCNTNQNGKIDTYEIDCIQKRFNKLWTEQGLSFNNTN